jgi:hypothetical protein
MGVLDMLWVLGVLRLLGMWLLLLAGLELLRMLACLKLLGGNLELWRGGLHGLGRRSLERGLGVYDALWLRRSVQFVGYLLGTVYGSRAVELL